eukprot:1446825-Rhodomonas_salina.2
MHLGHVVSDHVWCLVLTRVFCCDRRVVGEQSVAADRALYASAVASRDTEVTPLPTPETLPRNPDQKKGKREAGRCQPRFCNTEATQARATRALRTKP